MRTLEQQLKRGNYPTAKDALVTTWHRYQGGHDWQKTPRLRLSVPLPVMANWADHTAEDFTTRGDYPIAEFWGERGAIDGHPAVRFYGEIIGYPESRMVLAEEII